MKSTAAAVLLLVAVTLALYAPQLGYSPPYLHDAEVQFALHTRAIAASAHDANGRLLPLYFQMPDIGANVWFHPFIVYWTAPLLLFLPFSESTVRFATVLIASINVVVMYFVARDVFKRGAAGLLAAVLLIVTPAHFIHGRVAMDYLHPVPFILGWLWLIVRFEEERRVGYLYAGAAILGVGIYSYIASVAVMPMYLLMTLAYARWRARLSWVQLAGIAGMFLAALVPAVIWLSLHPYVIPETLVRYSSGSSPPSLLGLAVRIRELLTYTRIQEFLALYWDFFNPGYLFFAGGSNYINSTRMAGVFLIPFAVFLTIGIFEAATRSRSPISVIALAGFVTAPLAATAVGEPYAIDRQLGLLPFAVLLALYGWQVLTQSQDFGLKLAAVGLLALMPWQFASFYADYMGEYRERSAGAFEFNIRGAAEELIANAGEGTRFYLSNKIPYARVYWRFYLAKAGVPWYDDETTMFDASTDSAADAPPGSLFMAHVADVELANLAKEGTLRLVKDVPELGGQNSLFVIYQR